MVGIQSLPPGIPFVFGVLVPRLSLPPLAVLCAYRVANYLHGVTAPPWALALACVLSVPLALSAYVWQRDYRFKREAAAAGAVMVPRWDGKMLGNLDIVALLVESFERGYIGDAHVEPIKALGATYDIVLFWKHQVVTVHPEHIKLILASRFDNHEKGPVQFGMLRSLLGTGVFNSDGDMWKFHRSMTRPFFSRERIGHFDIFDQHADTVLTKMKQRFQEGYAVDFQDVIQRFTLDSATDFLFGTCLHCLDSDLPYPHHVQHLNNSRAETQADKFVKAFASAQVSTASRFNKGWLWPLWEMFKDGPTEHMKTVNEFIEPILQTATENAKHEALADNKSHNTVEDSDTLLDHLVRFTSDKTVLRDETLNILLAGRDTTAGMLTWVVYLLAQNPNVHTRLREEIFARVGPNQRPTYEDIREMKYLRAVINETLRLYPAVPFDVRVAKDSEVWPNPDPTGKPFYIPAGTWLIYSVFMMQRRPELWGPDADKFDPDRFIDERLQKYLTPNPFIFLPFNAGPRICLGQQFAYNEMSFFLIRLLQNFSSISLDLSAQPPEGRPPADWAQSKVPRKAGEQVFPKAHLTMYAQGGLWVKMEEGNTETV